MTRARITGITDTRERFAYSDGVIDKRTEVKTLDQHIEVDVPHHCAAVDGVWFDLDMAWTGTAAVAKVVIVSVRVLNADTPPGEWVDPVVHFTPDVVDYLERYNWRQP